MSSKSVGEYPAAASIPHQLCQAAAAACRGQWDARWSFPTCASDPQSTDVAPAARLLLKASLGAKENWKIYKMSSGICSRVANPSNRAVNEMIETKSVLHEWLGDALPLFARANKCWLHPFWTSLLQLMVAELFLHGIAAMSFFTFLARISWRILRQH